MDLYDSILASSAVFDLPHDNGDARMIDGWITTRVREAKRHQTVRDVKVTYTVLHEERDDYDNRTTTLLVSLVIICEEQE